MSDREALLRHLTTSKDTFRSAALRNGAIVSAGPSEASGPPEGSGDHAVWPRVAAFTCVAGDVLGVELQEPFFHWLDAAPESFRKERLLYANYTTSGRLGSGGHRFEPDQMGTVLWAIGEHVRRRGGRAEPFSALIRRLADGLAAVWDERRFIPTTADLWGTLSRSSSERGAGEFTYSLAACVRGLEIAHALLPTREWETTAQQMRREINHAYDATARTFTRQTRGAAGRGVDASLLGLLWPFEIVTAQDERFRATVERIEETLVVNGGIRRFPFDYADRGGNGGEGGGAWPVLSFWMSIVQHRLGNRGKALAYYDWVLERSDGPLPRQYFDDFQVSVAPYTWSHAIFILASDELDVLEGGQ